MAIAFDQVPSANRIPTTFYEQDGSGALAAQAPAAHSVLLIGTRLSTGSSPVGQIVGVTGENEGDGLFGAQSQLSAMVRAFKRVNGSARLYALPVDENGAGTAATSTVTLAGTSTRDGTVRLRVGDRRVSVALPSGTTAADSAANLAAAVTAAERIFHTAGAAGAVLTLTFAHKGEAGNAVTVEAESLPTGITATIVQPSGGATDPTLASAIAALPDQRFDTIVTAFTSAANMTALENEMARRWGPLVKQPGLIHAAVRGTHGALTTYGNARNSAFSSVMGTGQSPTPPWIWASQVAARDAQVCDTIVPNRPRNGLTLPDVEAPKLADRLDQQERNLLLYDGISTYKVDASGNVMVERLVTTYQTNASGLADATYVSVETLRNLAGIYLEALALGAKYDRHLVAPDGTAVDAGVPVVTPKALRGELIAWNDSLIRRGRTKDAEGFASTLLVEINAQDGERIDVLMGTRLVRGLVTLAIRNAFRL
jgi:phage tail sheath gpL-like